MGNDSCAITKMFDRVSLGAPQNAVGFVMWRVMHRYIRAVDRALRPCDLTHLQFTTLTLVAWMGRGGETASQADLARFGDIHPMQVSNVLKALEQKGLVGRTPSPGHALAKLVAITPAGLDALHATLPLVIAVQEGMFGAEGRPGGALLVSLAGVDGSAS